MHKCSGIGDIREVGTQGTLQTPPWGRGGLREEVTLSGVLKDESEWVRQGRERRQCVLKEQQWRGRNKE